MTMIALVHGCFGYRMELLSGSDGDGIYGMCQE